MFFWTNRFEMSCSLNVQDVNGMQVVWRQIVR